MASELNPALKADALTNMTHWNQTAVSSVAVQGTSGAVQAAARAGRMQQPARLRPGSEADIPGSMKTTGAAGQTSWVRDKSTVLNDGQAAIVRGMFWLLAALGQAVDHMVAAVEAAVGVVELLITVLFVSLVVAVVRLLIVLVHHGYFDSAAAGTCSSHMTS